MNIDVETINNNTVLKLSDKIDFYNAAMLNKAIREQVLGNRNLIILNMEKVFYIDSSGLGVIISNMIDLQKSGGSLKIAGLNSTIRKTLKVTYTTDLFDIYETVSEAMESCKKN